ncbi:response regulator transcription factor [Lishizhenia sp.]|uniref:response regulator transcription factor n=1 Tax=Lishizhenia sp. TaxID=2497594 RepID=UPI00299CFD9B|nr:response regulator transcription factor [Lishizhenia sp.]MDX1445906.1 response regulator transcription factor [Lishizhenia sp.]
MNMKKVLIIDDEEDIRELIQYNLEKEGFEVSTAENGKLGLEKLKESKPDLILLDVMMPEMDGMEVCEIIRKNSSYNDVVICFLTARNEDYSQIAGLDIGGDDYISKPVKPKVLVSRINALLRRGGMTASEEENNEINEDLIIDREQYLVILKGKKLHLPKKEFELLSLLASKPQKVFGREIILDTVWGNEIVVGDRTIDVHVRKLREKIGSDYIQTVKGVGYKFIA